MPFPENVVSALKGQVGDIGPSATAFTVVGRPLRPIDPNPSIGVYCVDWRAQEHEIGQHHPVVSRFFYVVQLMVKHTDEEEALAIHSDWSRELRLKLYQDVELKQQVTTLAEESQEMIERVSNYGVERQRFMNNELGGEYIYLSNLELWVDVETVQAF